MTVLNYVHHQSVAGGYDTVDKVRTFAVSQGWVQNEWITGYSWDYSSPYGFTVVDANGCFLELSSSGYGSQSLEARIQHNYRSDCGTNYLFVNMSNGDDYTIQNTLPWSQNTKTRTGVSGWYSSGWSMHLGNATYDDLWIFGDEKFIMAVCSMDGIFCQQFFFGSMIMFQDDPTEGDCKGMHFVQRAYPNEDCPLWSSWTENFDGYPAHWSSVMGIYADWRNVAMDIYWDGGSTIGELGQWSLGWNMFPWDSMSDSSIPLYLDGVGTNQPGLVPILNLGQCLRTNSYSNKRPMFRQTHFGKRSSDSVWEPICKTPYYFLNTSGLTIGQQLTYGSEEFLCFPIGPYYSPVGIAMQIA